MPQTPATHATVLETHDGIPGGELRAAWAALVDMDPYGTVFHTPDYLELWHRELGKRAAARVRTVTRDGDLLGVIAEAHELEGSPTGPIEVIRFLGGTEVTDYLGPVSRPEDRDAVVGAYVDALAEDRDWDELVAGGLPEGSGWLEPLRAHAERTGLTILEDVVEDVCPRVEMPETFEDYLATLPGRQRHEMKRKARKLARDVGDVELRQVAPEDIAEGLATFFEMASDGDGEKSRFFVNDDMQRFFHALAEAFAADGNFRLHLLDVAGAPAAATVSLVHGDEWGLYNSAFDQRLGMLAPGMVLIGELLRETAAEGLAVFDLLRGDESYKYRFGAEDRVLRRLTITRR